LLAAKFNAPAGVAVDVSGSHLYIADTGNHAIRLINLANNTVSTFAGAPGASGVTDGPYADARFNAPADLVVDGNGDVFVADTGNSLIREITVISGTRLVRTLAGGTLTQGAGASAAAGALSQSTGAFPAALPAAAGAFPAAMIAPAEVPASAPAEGGFLDGSGTDARFNPPGALALAPDGTLYVADTGNQALRTIAPDANATVGTIPLHAGPAVGDTGGSDTGGSGGKSGGGGGGGGGGGAPSLWLLVALAALTALRVRTRRME
jgi:sugar lactone lactonase YvrE